MRKVAPARMRSRRSRSSFFQVIAISPSYAATPRPALRSAASFGPAPVQQPASLPLIATAGTVLTPYCLAFVATSGLFMSSTSTSHEEQAICWTSFTVSAHAGHPALNTSTFRLLVFMISPLHSVGQDRHPQERTAGIGLPQDAASYSIKKN